MANNYLTKNAKIQIKKILGHDDLSRVSTWADEIKSDPKWDHAWNWHFCTIPDGEDYIKGKYNGDVIEKIREFRGNEIAMIFQVPVSMHHPFGQYFFPY